MDIAQGQAAKAASGVDTTFHITLELKPRVARFFRQSFDGHPTMSVEERMAKFLEIQLNKLRGQALAQTRIEATEATEGEARTIRRSVFLQNHGGENPAGGRGPAGFEEDVDGKTSYEQPARKLT
jgi:hypothetical protein